MKGGFPNYMTHLQITAFSKGNSAGSSTPNKGSNLLYKEGKLASGDDDEGEDAGSDSLIHMGGKHAGADAGEDAAGEDMDSDSLVHEGEDAGSDSLIHMGGKPAGADAAGEDMGSDSLVHKDGNPDSDDEDNEGED